MEIRAYSGTELELCLAIFDSNNLHSSDQTERGAFEQFLDRPSSPYFVMEHDKAIVGCGGYTIDSKATEAKLVWGMIRRDSQRLGLGRFLLLFRLREIGKTSGISFVRVETSPHFVPFFEKQGFKLSNMAPNGFVSEAGRVTLLKRLTVCA